MRTILFALLIAFGVNAPVQAADCKTIEQLVATLTASNPQYATETVVDLREAEAQSLIDWWNRMPPRSDTVADRIVVLRGVNRETAVEYPKYGIVLILKGCIVDSGALPSYLVRQQIPQS